MKIKPQLTTRFVGSFNDVRKMPRRREPEFAFIGRSNVGKSSLINMLVGSRVAHTSSQPGKTQAINLFEVEKKWLLADLPGYGYARRSKKQRHTWQKMLADYLTQRPNLAEVFVLVDARLDPQPIDLDFIRWAGEQQIPFSIVLTKTDKLSNNELKKRLTQWHQLLSPEWEELPPMWVTSAVARTGREELLRHISEVVEQWRAQTRLPFES